MIRLLPAGLFLIPRPMERPLAEPTHGIRVADGGPAAAGCAVRFGAAFGFGSSAQLGFIMGVDMFTFSGLCNM
jgi:hypothetical protein